VTTELEAGLRQKVKELVSSGKVDLAVGYGRKYMGEEVRPLLARSAADADRLIWDEHCVHNLASYLVREPCLGLMRKGGRVGMVAKGCDVRSILGLIQEKQLGRDSVHVIGMVCGGMRNEAGETLVKCRQCKVQVPAVYDDLVGQTSQAERIEGDPLEDIKAVEAMSQEERWRFWTGHFSRCIKCYACRQACPHCYCKECITEKSRPQWIDKASSLKGNIAYHYIRAMHLAGRCVACGECSRVCPMDIPVDMLSRYLSHKVEEAFGYRPGEDAEQEPFFVKFADQDPEDFIR
jgi:formate dehydrogenase subunit beta